MSAFASAEGTEAGKEGRDDNAGHRPESSPPREGAEGRSGSLRTRLIVTNVVITALAVAALGYYVFYRTQQSTNALADQLDASIRQQAEANLALQAIIRSRIWMPSSRP